MADDKPAKKTRKTRPAILQVQNSAACQDAGLRHAWHDVQSGPVADLRDGVLMKGIVGRRYRIVRPCSDPFSIAEEKTRTFAGVAKAVDVNDEAPPTGDA